MRIIVFFDLPVTTSAERTAYTHFRKFLLKGGFMMMQESVYCKLVPNGVVCNGVMENIRKNKPEAGLVQMLTITEKQFGKMEFVVGENTSEVLTDDRRLVLL